MTQEFWFPPAFGTPNENTCEIPKAITSYPNNLDNLGYGCEETTTGPLQLRSNASLMQAPDSLSADLGGRIASMAHISNETLFRSSNSGPSLNTSISNPGLIIPSPLPNLSSYSSIQNSASYTSNNDVSYHLTQPTSAHQAYSTTAHNLIQPLGSQDRNGHSIPFNSGMPPPLRSVQYPTSPPPLASPLRNDYGASSYHSRSLQPNVNPFQLTSSPSPPLSLNSHGGGSVVDRASPSSSSTCGYVSNSMQLDIPAMTVSGRDVPPFDVTKGFNQLVDDAGRHVSSEIHAKIDKGFFRADSDWCCYRRNYFSVACSYNLTSSWGDVDHERVHLLRENRRDLVHGFYVSIAAKVNGEDGRAIELVQHTAKRDKGPMNQPERKLLKPNPTGNLHLYSGTSTFGSPHSLEHDYSDPYGINPSQDNPSVANFDRIQFKKATANNGKRRAAQQYFHIVVELYARVQKQNGAEDYVKVAHRESDQMVVRGRSPGHYNDSPRSSSNMGGGTGAGGSYGSIPRDIGSSLGMGSHSTINGNYSTRAGEHSTFHAHQHDTQGSYLMSSPGMFNQSFIEPVTTIGTIPRPAPNDHYYGNVSFHNQGYPSRLTTASISVSSTGKSTSPYGTLASFHTMSPSKEDKPRTAGLMSLQLPVLGAWGNTHDTFQPPRDCRPWHNDPQRAYHPTMSAL